MAYKLTLVPDAVFWNELCNAPTADTGDLTPKLLKLLNFRLTLMNYNPLTTWKNNGHVRFPETPSPIIGFQILITPESKRTKSHRIFLAALYSQTQGIVVEISVLQLFVITNHVATEGGNNWQVPLNDNVWKGDTTPIMLNHTDPDSKSSIRMMEKANENSEQPATLRFICFSTKFAGDIEINPEAATTTFNDTMDSLGMGL